MSNQLPPGWTITHSNEQLPDLHLGTPMQQPLGGFVRETWTCRDSAGRFICADGVESACHQQALALAQSGARP